MLCINFVSAGVSIKPVQVKPDNYIKITIDIESYGQYLHFYAQDSESAFHSIDLGCGETCYGKKSFDYMINSSIFNPGFYNLAVYSVIDNKWLFYGFEVIEEGEETCTDSDVTDEYPEGKNYYVKGTVCFGGECFTDYCNITAAETPRYINEYSCGRDSILSEVHKCPENYICSNGACIKTEIEEKNITKIFCNDGTLANQCSSTKPLYCDSSGNLTNICLLCGCPEDYGCQDDGSCALPFVPPIAPNKKLKSLYSDKEVFLISSKDWRNVLQSVSLTTWTEGNKINKYPTLVFYEGKNSFYTDSIIYFIQQYNPTMVTIIGETPQGIDDFLVLIPDLGAGLSLEQIQRINVNDYMNYWDSFDTLVYVEDNYELALMASTYASLINAPLIIQGTAKDSADVFSGREVLCVGSVTPTGTSCTETYNLEQLQKKYKSKTNTDKIILVNSNDLNWSLQTFRIKASLISPILASAKHELIISTTTNNSEEINSHLKHKMQEIFNYKVKYLTIIAPDEIIPHSSEGRGLSDWKTALDASLYADLNNDNKPDVLVGRISGFTVTDVSSYIARALFYDSFTKTNNAKFMASSFNGLLKDMTDRISTYFSNAGYNSVPVTVKESWYDFNPTEWENQDLIYYTDHGKSGWAGIESYEIPNLDNSLVIVAACDTVKTLGPYSFAVSVLKNGAIGYVGCVSTTFLSTEYTKYLNEIFYYGRSLGEAFKNVYEPTKFHGGDILLGDPTLNINPKHLLKKEIPILIIPKKCKTTGDWCCEGTLCLLLKQTCCSPLTCEGGLLIKECKDTRCEGTDTSCGFNEATGSCTNCDAMPPESLVCNLLKTKVKGYYFKCNNDQLCMTKTFKTVIEDCPQYCEDGECKCYTKGTKVTIFDQGRCCEGWEWVTKTVHRWPECGIGKGSGCGKWTHDRGYKTVNDYKVCK